MKRTVPGPISFFFHASRTNWPVLLVGTLFVLVALWLSLNIPVFEGPDENEHFLYMVLIAKKHRLPTYSLETSPEQKIQPPLYYAVGALLAGWTPLDDLDRYLIRNPHASISRVHVPGNKNAFIHARDEPLFQRTWPQQKRNGTLLAVYLFRWLSVALGLGTVITTYLLALETFNRARWPALAAMALVAFNPQFVYLSSLINTDNAVIMLSTIGLLQAACVLRRPPSLRLVAWLGLVAGLAALAKVTGLGVLGIGLIAVTVVALRQRSWRYWVLASGILVALTMVIGGWWYARNWWLYGDPFLGNLLQYHFSENPQFADLDDWISPFLQAETSYWAVFGWLNIAVPENFYRAFTLFTRVGLVGLLLFALRGLLRRPVRASYELAGFLLLWCGLILGGLVTYVRVFGGLQGRHFFPMIASLSILLTIGWMSLLPRRLWAWFCGGLAAVLLVLSVLLPARYVLPHYIPPPTITPDRIPVSARQTPRYFGDAIGLLGAEVDPGPASPGQRSQVVLYWQALKPIEINYSVFVHLLDGEGQVVGQSNSYPAQGLLATSIWQPGEVIIDAHQVLVDEDAPAPLVARIDVGLYRFEAPDQPGPRPLDDTGQPTLAIVGQTKITPAQWPEVQPSVPFDIRFDDGIILTGADQVCNTRSRRCTLTLYWQPTARPSADYTVFIQLWRDDHQVAGFDGPPVEGNYPTSWWGAAEVIIDRHTFELPGDLPPGDYHVQIGLYQLESGARLPAFTPDGMQLADFSVKVGQIYLE